MRPIGVVIFAVLARLLWIFPAWVAGAAGVALALFFVGLEFRSWLRNRSFVREALVDNGLEHYKPAPRCPSRSTIGQVYHRCGLSEGHEGPHEGDLCRYWDQSA